MKLTLLITLLLGAFSLNAQGPNQDFILLYSSPLAQSGCASADLLDSIRQESYDFTSDEFYATSVNHYYFTPSGEIETIAQLDVDDRDTLGLTITDYDSNGNRTLFRFYSNTPDGELFLATEINDDYDPMDRLVKSTFLGASFLAPDDTLVYNMSTHHDHDEFGIALRIDYESFNFLTRKWEQQSRVINTTDGSGKIVQQSTLWWNPNLMAYIDIVGRVDNIFSNGLISCSSVFSIPTNGTTLALNSKSTTEYDGNDNRISVVSQRADNNGNLYLSTKTETSYTSCDLPDVETTFRYDTLSMIWIPVVRNTYYYSPSVSVDDIETVKINTYPNPTTGRFILSGLTESVASLEIYNSNGNKIKGSEVKTTDDIDLSHYPAGQYFIRLKTGSTTYTSTLLKIN